jgi:hypothetical protein
VAQSITAGLSDKEKKMTKEDAPRTMNPLWIISSFLGISEVMIGVSTTQATGWIQDMLAIFSIVFPIAVATVFFIMLWKKPYVLYSPKDYTSETNVSAFVEAMTTISPTRKMKALDSLISSAVEGTLTELPPGKLDAKQIQGRVEDAIRATHERIEETLAFINITEIKPEIPLVAIPILDGMTVQNFMDEMWYSLSPKIEPYTYGKTWILENTDTGERLAAVHTDLERDYLNSHRWNEPLSEFGIGPGVKLTVRRLTWERSGP